MILERIELAIVEGHLANELDAIEAFVREELAT